MLSSLFLFTTTAQASNWRYGAGLGFGGTGITKSKEFEGGTKTVERAESPGTFQIYIDRPLTQRWLVSLEHSRGFRLGPFTFGVGFTSLIGRWYYMGQVPDLVKTDGESSTFVQKRWSPYVGGATGVAEGKISREGAQIRTVTGSGVHMGFRTGVDYLWRPNVGLRSELSYATTIFSSSNYPATLTEFSLWTGFFISP